MIGNFAFFSLEDSENGILNSKRHNKYTYIFTVMFWRHRYPFISLKKDNYLPFQKVPKLPKSGQFTCISLHF